MGRDKLGICNVSQKRQGWSDSEPSSCDGYVFFISLRFLCNNCKFHRFRAEDCSGNIRIIFFNFKTVSFKFFPERFRTEILQPVVYGLCSCLFDYRVFIKNDFFFVIFECVQKTVIIFRLPETVELHIFVCWNLFSLIKSVQWVHIKQNRTAGIQKPVKPGEHFFSLDRKSVV